MELIDKEKVLKEVQKVYDEGYKFLPSDLVESVGEFKDELLRVIDTLSTVKEVDLDLEITLWANAIPEIQLDDIERLAKHFFELGINAKKGE